MPRSTPQQRAERREDLIFMAEHGETVAGAATRLGITVKNLDRWCCRHAPDARAALQANTERPGRIRLGHLPAAS